LHGEITRAGADGRFAWITDPGDAAVGLFESDIDPGSTEGATPGYVCRWILESPDPPASAAFHEQMFGRPLPPDTVRTVPPDRRRSGRSLGAWRAALLTAGTTLPRLAARPLGEDLFEFDDPDGNHCLLACSAMSATGPLSCN
jgi:hypothetical protein